MAQRRIPGKTDILNHNTPMLQHPQALISITNWQRSLANAVRSPRELLEILGLPLELLGDAVSADQEFPLRVTHSYINRMAKGDPQDPLLLQVLPQGNELIPQPGFDLDPVGDHDAVIGQGLLKKYHGRVLVMTTPACAIHCRYCFRRHFPYTEHSSRRGQWQQLAQTIASDESLQEVILSGGDPLSLDDKQLGEFISLINDIPHIKRIRIHSRYPIVLPERITNQLLHSIEHSRCTTIVVIHSNHANEINDEVRESLKKLNAAGAQLFNQAVLLKNINDNCKALAQLSETLFDGGVIPYYLHMLDRVQGAAHFEVPEAHARQLLEQLREQLPGYLVPKLVREEAGELFKKPIGY